jgi:uncharacterized membrane protein
LYHQFRVADWMTDSTCHDAVFHVVQHYHWSCRILMMTLILTLMLMLVLVLVLVLMPVHYAYAHALCHGYDRHDKIAPGNRCDVNSYWTVLLGQK